MTEIDIVRGPDNTDSRFAQIIQEYGTTQAWTPVNDSQNAIADLQRVVEILGPISDLERPNQWTSVLELNLQRDSVASGPASFYARMMRHSTESSRVHARVEHPERFYELRDRWIRETKFGPSGTRRFMNSAYQKIIGLGPAALPLILIELEQRPDEWYWALAAIAGEDPASGEVTIDGARLAWLAWGRDKGLIG